MTKTMNTPRIIPPSELIINGDGSAFHIHLRPDQLRDNIIFVGDPGRVTMVGSLFLLLWITDWNNYGTALLYLSKLPTLAVGIYQFKQRMIYGSRLDILYAGCTISLLPPLVMFIICNNALMSNVSLGGIKE